MADVREITFSDLIVRRLPMDQKGVLVGIYEINHEHWAMDGAPWNYGEELFQEQLDRIENELMLGFARYPAIQEVGMAGASQHGAKRILAGKQDL